MWITNRKMTKKRTDFCNKQEKSVKQRSIDEKHKNKNYVYSTEEINNEIVKNGRIALRN